MTYGFLDFIWLQLFAWILIIVVIGALAMVINLFSRGVGKKNVIAVTLKDRS
jgi:hypothetical protein